MPPTSLNIKQGEAKTLILTVKQGGQAVNLTGYPLFLGVKRYKSDVAYAFSKDSEDDDFDRTQEAQGIVSVFLTATDTNQNPGTYVGELRVTFPGSVVEKSEDFFVVILKAVIPEPET